MPMKPHKGEGQSDFMSRCVPEMVGTGADKRPQEQAVAICLDVWRQEHGGKKPGGKTAQQIIARWQRLLAENKQAAPDPDDDESRADFMDRCVDELLDGDDNLDEDDATEACQTSWEDSRSADPPVMRHKTHGGKVNGFEFVLSDESEDRMGDVISSDGWDLENFKKNPIALFNHRSDFPIGKWRNLRVDKGALRGHLELAPEGTSERIDEIRKLVDAGILQAVSVGFRPIESKPRKSAGSGPFAGEFFIRQELVETSLVSVPANPNALAVAKALNISPATMGLVFAEHGKRDDIKRRGFSGGHADRTHDDRKGSAMSLAQRITDIEAQVVSMQEKLEQHLKDQDDTNVSDEDMQLTVDLNSKIAQLRKQHEALVESEKHLAGTTNGGGGNGKSRSLVIPVKGAGGYTHATAAQPIAIKTKKDPDVLEYIVRAGTVALASKIWNQPIDEVRSKVYGDDEGVKGLVDLMVTRAASAPAMTSVAGWAQELVQQIYTDLMPLLYPKSIYPRLAPKGLSLSFGRAGKIVIPTRLATPTIAGSFVGEGNPIPVRQGAFSSQTMVPKKMAVITTFTREMNEHSIPAIEGLLRDAIQEDTSVSIDSVLIDANPATAIRPAGLLNGVAAITATAGGGLTALIGDIKALVGALTTATLGNIRAPAWLMNPADVLSVSLTPAVAGGGQFPFREEILGGSLNGFPVIDSGIVPAKTVILVDAADFVSASGDGPRFEISDQATLHMEDTTPLQLASTGSPNVVAAPMRSLFQTDSLALRLILPMNWLLRRTGVVAWTQTVTW